MHGTVLDVFSNKKSWCPPNAHSLIVYEAENNQYFNPEITWSEWKKQNLLGRIKVASSQRHRHGARGIAYTIKCLS